MGKIVGMEIAKGGVCETEGWTLSNWIFDRLYGKFYREFANETDKRLERWNEAFDLHRPDWDGDWNDPNGLYQRFIVERMNSAAKNAGINNWFVKDIFVDREFGLNFTGALGRKYRLGFVS